MAIYESGEDYIETIYILKKRNGVVYSIDVAKELGLDASVLREAFRHGWMMGGPGMGHGPRMRGGEEPIPVPPPMPPKETE